MELLTVILFYVLVRLSEALVRYMVIRYYRLVLGRVDPTPNGKGYVYFWQDAMNPFTVKVGKTKNIKARFDTFQTAQAYPVRILGIVQVQDDRAAETFLHKRWAASRIRADGEWFYLTPDIVLFVWINRDQELTREWRRYIRKHKGERN